MKNTLNIKAMCRSPIKKILSKPCEVVSRIYRSGLNPESLNLKLSSCFFPVVVILPCIDVARKYFIVVHVLFLVLLEQWWVFLGCVRKGHRRWLHSHPRSKKNGLKIPQTAKLVLKLNRLFLSRRLLEISLQAYALRHENKGTSWLSTCFTPWHATEPSNYKLTFSSVQAKANERYKIYYTASSASRQDEPNPALGLATHADGMALSCQQGIVRCFPEENNVLFYPYNKSFMTNVANLARWLDIGFLLFLFLADNTKKKKKERGHYSSILTSRLVNISYYPINN